MKALVRIMFFVNYFSVSVGNEKELMVRGNLINGSLNQKKEVNHGLHETADCGTKQRTWNVCSGLSDE